MSDKPKVIEKIKEFDAHKADLTSQEVGKGADIIGLPDPNNLFTATNVGGAMHELFTNVSNGKTQVATAITDKGVNASGSDTFSQLATKIGQINTGKRVAKGTININTSTHTLNVRGLSFRPSVFVAMERGQHNAGVLFVEKSHLGTTNDVSLLLANTGAYNDPHTVYSDGILIRTSWTGASNTFDWYAIE